MCVQIGGAGGGALDIPIGALRLLRGGRSVAALAEVPRPLSARMCNRTPLLRADVTAGSVLSEETGGATPITIHAAYAGVDDIGVGVTAGSAVDGGLPAHAPSCDPPDQVFGDGGRCGSSC
jgi:hypothetical protein